MDFYKILCRNIWRITNRSGTEKIMRKYLILFLVLITILYTAFERYLTLTACETYSLKIHKGSLYLRYDILVNEMSEPKPLGKIYACRRHKTIEPDIFVKSMLEEYTYYKKINNNYYVKISITELLDGRVLDGGPQVLKKTTKKITGDEYGY